MQPTIAVTAVTLHQGDDLRSCSTCGEVEYVAWTVQVNQHHPETRCTNHASFDVLDAAMGQQFAASVVTATVTDDSLADDLIYGVVEMLRERVTRADLAEMLSDSWELEARQMSPARRVARARFLIGSAAFALLPSVPVPGDDDEADEFLRVAR